MLRILHISDLHQRGHADPDQWRRDLVLGEEWKRNLEEIGSVDFVCFTGDVAQSGKEEEYGLVTEFLDRSLALLGVPWERFFVVPGNHDVDREVAAAEYEAIRRWAQPTSNLLQLSRFLAGASPRPPEGLEASWLTALLERRRAYERWVAETIKRKELLPSAEGHPRLGYHVRVPHGGEHPIELIGLDSAWLSGVRDEKKLLVTEDQLGRLAPLQRGDGVLRIGLMHHSFADLLDGRSIQQLMAGRIDVLLRGHLHRTESAHFVLDHDRGFAELAASSLFDGGSLDQYPNGCQVVTIHRSDPLTGENWYRSWSTTNRFWHSDNSLYRRTQNGRLLWILGPGAMSLPWSGTTLHFGPKIDATISVGRNDGKVVGIEVGTLNQYYTVLQPSGPSRADYLRALRRHVSREAVSSGLMRPDRVYVPQRGRRLGVDDASEEMMRDALRGVWSGDQPRVMVFGNYGMGKTYLALRSVLDQIDAVIDPSPRPLPIYFPLRQLDCSAALTQDVLQHRDVLDQILAYLLTLDFPRLSRGELAGMLAGGEAAVVLDGLDELQSRSADWQQILAPLLDIEGARCVITTRTAYIEEKQSLLGEWILYELQPWSESEWTEYVRACAGEIRDVEVFLRSVAERQDLLTLTTRPLWCFMMVAVHERIGAEQGAGLSDLYQYFIDETLERVMRSLQQRQILQSRQKFMALERFAVKCANEQRSSLREEVFRALVSQFLHDQQLSAIEELLDRELKVYSFLNYDSHGYFTFGHTSFESYFVAASMARDLVPRLVDARIQLVDLRDTPIAKTDLTDEVLAFLAGIVRSVGATLSLGILPTAAAHATALCNLEHFVRDWLAHPAATRELRRNLFLLLLRILRAAATRPRVAGLLLRGVALAGQDLSHCDFENVVFTTARLQKATFAGSSLRGCRFTAAAIDDADFFGADLAGADFRGVQRAPRPPRFANVENAEKALGLDPSLLQPLAG